MSLFITRTGIYITLKAFPKKEVEETNLQYLYVFVEKAFLQDTVYIVATAYALLQDLTQDSATLTGWRRTKRSGDGKMIALYSPGICGLRYRSFP